MEESKRIVWIDWLRVSLPYGYVRPQVSFFDSFVTVSVAVVAVRKIPVVGKLIVG